MEDELALELGQRLQLPPLPEVIRILGKPRPGGVPEIVRFSRDGSILLASQLPGMSRAYDAHTGELLLDTGSHQLIDRIQANPRRARWAVIRFAATAVLSMVGLSRALDPKLTCAGRQRAKALGGPTGLADFDIASRAVRKRKEDWGVLSPDGRIWASVEPDGPLIFYDAATGTELVAGKPPSGDLETGASVFSRDARIFSAEARPGAVGIWDVRSGKLRATLKSHSGYVQALALSPDGNLMASAGGDGTLVLWDLAAERWLARQVGWEGGVTSIAFVPHPGRLLLAVTDTWSLGLFNVPSLEPATRLGVAPDESLGLTALDASPDGSVLAVGRLDDTVHMLDVAALLSDPRGIDGDTVQTVSGGPPGEEDDRRAAAAFRALAQELLDATSGPLEAELRRLVDELPEGARRVVFYGDPVDVTGPDSITWEATDGVGQPLAEGPVQVFAVPLIPYEALADPRYLSAETSPEETLEELFLPWLAARWKATAPRELISVLCFSDGHRAYDLRRAAWIEEDG